MRNGYKIVIQSLIVWFSWLIFRQYMDNLIKIDDLILYWEFNIIGLDLLMLFSIVFITIIFWGFMSIIRDKSLI